MNWHWDEMLYFWTGLKGVFSNIPWLATRSKSLGQYQVNRSRCYELYWRVRGWIAPRLKYSQYLYEDVVSGRLQSSTRWLELGCGHSILPKWRLNQEKELVGRCRFIAGLDCDLPSLKVHQTISRRVRGDITKLPFRDSSFDLVTMNMVVEHLDDPEWQFQDVHRVLAPGGVLIFHTPNAFGYGVLMARLVPDWPKRKIVGIVEGRPDGDIFKTFYRCNTEKRIRQVGSTAGFQVLDVKMIVTDAILVSVPPLFVPELVWIRALMTKPLKSLRTNIIGILQKPLSAD